MYPAATFLGKKFKLLTTKPSNDLLRDFLVTRNIRDGKGFLEPNVDDLHDPYLLPSMQQAVNRIMRAKQAEERVMIFGDYDADGVTSTAALFLFLRDDMGMQVSYRIPHRIHDGYGMKMYHIDEIAQTGTKLIITVDCGTRDLEAIRYARELGMDVIVTDHHLPGPQLPSEAIAIVNPHRSDSHYPFPHLSGAGVVLKLIQAIDETKVDTYIDICAIGTIADVMPLIDENRIIASLGLRKMSDSHHPCFQMLFEKNQKLDADVVGYQIGPLINAAGRMDSPLHAVQMLLADKDQAPRMIASLQKLNEERKAHTQMWYHRALQDISYSDNLLIYEAEIPHGIIGLVAGKIASAYNKPTIVLTREEDTLVASCRSPKYLHITEVLEKFSDRFLNYGGHGQAAGFTVSASEWSSLRDELSKLVQAQTKDLDTSETLLVDTALHAHEISLGTYEIIDQLAPFGAENEKPLFIFHDLKVDSIKKIGSDHQHLKMTAGNTDIVAWNWGEHYEGLARRAHLRPIGHLEINEWNGTRKVQIRLVDMI